MVANARRSHESVVDLRCTPRRALFVARLRAFAVELPCGRRRRSLPRLPRPWPRGMRCRRSAAPDGRPPPIAAGARDDRVRVRERVAPPTSAAWTRWRRASSTVKKRLEDGVCGEGQAKRQRPRTRRAPPMRPASRMHRRLVRALPRGGRVAWCMPLIRPSATSYTPQAAAARSAAFGGRRLPAARPTAPSASDAHSADNRAEAPALPSAARAAAAAPPSSCELLNADQLRAVKRRRRRAHQFAARGRPPPLETSCHRATWLVGRGLAWPASRCSASHSAARRPPSSAAASRRLAAGVEVCTFHAWCLRLLRAFATELGRPAGFSLSSSAQQIELIRQALEEFQKQQGGGTAGPSTAGTGTQARKSWRRTASSARSAGRAAPRRCTGRRCQRQGAGRRRQAPRDRARRLHLAPLSDGLRKAGLVDMGDLPHEAHAAAHASRGGGGARASSARADRRVPGH